MIPLHDDNPTELKPVVTVALIAACCLVFLGQMGLPGVEGRRFVFEYGFIPALLFAEARPSGWTPPLSAELTVITSMFLHGGWMHLIGNMLYLWIFGNNVEDAVGHGKFVVFYVVCGIAAAMTQGLADPASTIPMVGASGAIGGVLGAYLLLYPRARVLVLIPLGIFIQVVRIPAVFALGLWFAMQLVFQALAGPQTGGGVAYWAHIGGFAAGALLILGMRPAWGAPVAPGGRRRASAPVRARRRPRPEKERSHSPSGQEAEPRLGSVGTAMRWGSSVPAHAGSSPGWMRCRAASTGVALSFHSIQPLLQPDREIRKAIGTRPLVPRVVRRRPDV